MPDDSDSTTTNRECGKRRRGKEKDERKKEARLTYMEEIGISSPWISLCLSTM